MRWNKQDQEELINSIFDNISIGEFTLGEFKKRITKDVIDGLSRLRTINDFKNDKFSCGGKKYSELDEETKVLFLNFVINIRTYDNLSKDQTEKLFRQKQRGIKMSTGDILRSYNCHLMNYIKSTVKENKDA